MSRKYATRAGVNLTAKNAEKPKTTSNNQHPTSRKAPRSKHQRTTAESHIQSGEVWQLGLGAWIFFGCWMLSFPDDKARRLGCRNLLRAVGIPCPSRASVAPAAQRPRSGRAILPALHLACCYHRLPHHLGQRPLSSGKERGRVSVVGFAVY